MRPVLFTLAGYDVLAGPVFAGIAALAAFFYMRRRRSYAQLDEDELWNLMAFLTLGTFAGGVLLYIALFGGGPANNLAYMLTYKTIRGGTFYGNFWGCIAAAMLYAKIRKKSLPAIADLVAAASMLGLFFMRWGCMQHGCCFGTYCDLPWSITFDIPNYGVRNTLMGVALHPTQVYSAIASLLIFLFIHVRVFPRIRQKKLPAGAAFALTVILYSLFRFFSEFLRGSDYGIFQPFGLTTSQLLAMASILIALNLYGRWMPRKTP